MSAPDKSRIRQNAYLEKARVALAKNNDDAALSNFKRSCLYCDCNRELRRRIRAMTGSQFTDDIPLPLCHCRDILSLDPADEDRQAIYKLASKACTCGSGIQPCDSQAHLDALNGMATVCGRIRAYKDALSYSSLLILVAPLTPTGYLRLAKTLRLRDASEGTDTKKQSNWIYLQLKGAGIMSSHLKGLINVFKVDIIRNSPPEIQEKVLKLLSFKDLCRCMRVSRAWNYASRNAGLWRHLEFVKLWPTSRVRPFRKDVLNDIISRRSKNLAHSLTISGLRDFAIDETRLCSILRGLPHLECLTIHEVAPHMFGGRRQVADFAEETLDFRRVLHMLCRDAPKCLRTLHMDYFEGSKNVPPSIDLPSTVSFAASLQELRLGNMRHIGLGYVIRTMRSTQWPNLEKLHLGSADRQRANVETELLMPVTPSLKEFSGESIDCILPDDGPVKAWENLERLRLVSSGIKLTKIPPVTLSGLRSLEIEGYGLECLIRAWYWHRKNVVLDKLEHLHCTSVRSKARRYTQHMLMECMDPIDASSANGTLRSLEIDFRPEVYDGHINKNIIRTLSCHGILAASVHEDGHAGQTQEFLDWIDGFPNLTTVGIFPQKAERAWMVVAKLLRKLDDTSLIKTIYTDALYGVYRDQIIEEAAQKGIQIIHATRVPEPPLSPLPTASRAQA